MGIKEFKHLKKSLSDIESNTKKSKNIENEIRDLDSRIIPLKEQIKEIRVQFEPAVEAGRNEEIAKLVVSEKWWRDSVQKATIELNDETVSAKSIASINADRARILGYGMSFLWIYALMNILGLSKIAGPSIMSGFSLSPIEDTSFSQDMTFCGAWLLVLFLFFMTGAFILDMLGEFDPESPNRRLGTKENKLKNSLNGKRETLERIESSLAQLTFFEEDLPVKLKSLEIELENLEKKTMGQQIEKSRLTVETDALWEGIRHLLPHSNLLGSSE